MNLPNFDRYIRHDQELYRSGVTGGRPGFRVAMSLAGPGGLLAGERFKIHSAAASCPRALSESGESCFRRLEPPVHSVTHHREGVT